MTTVDGLPAQVLVLERGWLSANNIVFVGRDETAVVDTGYATHSVQTLALIESALAGRPLDLILNTHLHSDHCGGNAALQTRYSGVETRIPPGEASSVENWDEDGLSFRATGQTCPRFRFEALLQPGHEVVLSDIPWEVHAAPGHDPHSVILFEPRSRTLISADALWENGFGVVFPELAGEPSFGEVAATLELIETLKPHRVIPGHGAVFNETAGALRLARTRLDTFARNPPKHAWHAVKVLVKFKLLEMQTMSVDEWKSWVRQTPYMETIRARFFPTSSLDDLGDQALEALVKIGAASASTEQIQNR
ncbi:MBL fold metallo-hydrolase [Variovorax sp. J22P240]|uniref:MBL fold metallo-hydrolase n=1 Tax=Variovorax sp. J22P240 TaxID=3053514 RepID=UPI0025772FBE|nr:MBL fold metallo-hydrolase [Variovorax sp. J22P240]MDL9999446.1 MBL fold metallo-hydrolase [Variovorax sp. J22P240]